MGSALLRAVAALVLLAGLAGLAWFLRSPEAAGDGPEPVAWDRQSCAHCRMSVGEPAFAVQAKLASGEVLHFDDPGCYFWAVEQGRPELRATWFHELEGDGWVRSDEVAFVRVPVSPMGFGLGAVKGEAAGSVSLDEARRLALATTAHREGAP